MFRSVPLALIENNSGTRQAYHTYLCAQPEFDCVLLAGSVEEFLALLPTATRPPRLVLAALEGPGVSVGTDVAHLRRALPAAAVLLLTGGGDAAPLYQALCAGAVGYLAKSSRLREMKATLLDVLAGGAPMSPALARHVERHFQAVPGAELSAGEWRLVQALGEGNSYRLVAERLGLPLPNLRTRIRGVYAKLAGCPPAWQ